MFFLLLSILGFIIWIFGWAIDDEDVLWGGLLVMLISMITFMILLAAEAGEKNKVMTVILQHEAIQYVPLNGHTASMIGDYTANLREARKIYNEDIKDNQSFWWDIVTPDYTVNLDSLDYKEPQR